MFRVAAVEFIIRYLFRCRPRPRTGEALCVISGVHSHGA